MMAPLRAGGVGAGADAAARSARLRTWRSVAAIATEEGTGHPSRALGETLQMLASSGRYLRSMAHRIDSSSLPNGLPIHRVEIPGTRALTVLVAFDAGARTERPEENGMAHFLEHLVFKGGEKYDDYRKVNETAERMGAVLNAYTSHDLVAFHITCRAEVARRRDRPADRLRRAPEDRRRGARPRARRRDPGDRALQRPAVGRRRAPDRPRRVRRPPARAPRARARRSTCARSRARRSSRSAPASGRAPAAVRSSSATSTRCPTTRELAERVLPLPVDLRPTAASSPRRRSRRRRSWRSATPTSRTCGCPTGPTIDAARRPPRAPR